MSISPRFVSREDAKEAGWFSRRHKTEEAHRTEQEYRRQREAAKHPNGAGKMHFPTREEWAAAKDGAR